MKKLIAFLKKETMLTVSLLAAAAALFITPPTTQLFGSIDWRTLGTLLMMLTVLEGFKRENIFAPLIRRSGRIRTMTGISFFLIFSVFFSSMFVTNDVSLIVFVPLTILLFRAGGKEQYILPVISMENIAAIRGSLLTPFGSPQNLFLFGQSGWSVGQFLACMLPLCIMSGILLSVFILILYRKDRREAILVREDTAGEPWRPERRRKRNGYLLLFLLVVGTIVSRTRFWYVSLVIVLITALLLDRTLFRQVDYVLLATFLCFFVFSSSISANGTVSAFLRRTVYGREYWSSILLSQVISNVPASIVLWPFSGNLKGLLYGLDSAGLCSIIGSLASVINYRLYVREYPLGGKNFLKTFTLISWAFFAIVALPGWLLSR